MAVSVVEEVAQDVIEATIAECNQLFGLRDANHASRAKSSNSFFVASSTGSAAGSDEATNKAKEKFQKIQSGTQNVIAELKEVLSQKFPRGLPATSSIAKTGLGNK